MLFHENVFQTYVTINASKWTQRINGDEVTHASECNKEGTDMRMNSISALSSECVVGVTFDADVLIFMIYIYQTKMGL